jgi:hypothetical protein
MQIGLVGIVIIAICLVIVAVVALPTLNTMFANQTWMKVSLAAERTLRWQSFLAWMGLLVVGLLLAGVVVALAYFHKATVIAQVGQQPQITENKTIHIHLAPGQKGPEILRDLIAQGQVRREDAHRVQFLPDRDLRQREGLLIEGQKYDN